MAVDDTAYDTVTTPPVILYSDSLNRQQQQQNMSNEKYMLDSGITSTSLIPRPVVSRPLERKLSQGARLSKYNFLSQAFSQMRTSYAGENANNMSMNATTTTTASKSLNTDTNHNHDSMVLPHDKPKKYQMYQQHQDSSSDNMLFPSPPSLPPNAASTTSFYFDPNTTATRESTMTVGTLHASLFHKQQTSTPSPTSLSSPVRQKQYTSHLTVSPAIDADSVVSDVSQYSSKQSSPTTTTTSAALNHNKPYPFF